MNDLAEKAYAEQREILIGQLRGRVRDLQGYVDHATPETVQIWERMRRREVYTYVEQLEALKILLKVVESCTAR